MKPTRNPLLPHQRLDAWRVCVELSHEVRRLVVVMPARGTKERREMLKNTSLAAVRCVVEGANAYGAVEKVHAFAAARQAVGVVASELEMLRHEGLLTTADVEVAYGLAARETAMLTRLVAKFGGLPGR